jgi:hypothetical protein
MDCRVSVGSRVAAVTSDDADRESGFPSPLKDDIAVSRSGSIQCRPEVGLRDALLHQRKPAGKEKPRRWRGWGKVELLGVSEQPELGRFPV